MNLRMCLLAPGLLLLIGLSAAQDITVERGRGGPVENEKLESPEKRPLIRYGRQRTSKSWLEVAGSRVPIDDGIEWKGRRYYITLNFDLVGTEVGTAAKDTPSPEKVLWERDIGAFWNQIGIETFESEPGKETEALALRTTEHAEIVEFVDLATGKKIGGTDTAAAPGTPLALGGSWKGAEGKDDGARFALLRTPEEWTRTRAELFGDLASAPPADLGVDFATYGVLVVYSGKTVNSNGHSARAFENDRTVVVRITSHTYQSAMETPDRWPWGVFAVPLRPGKDLVVERNAQNYIGGPPMWKEWKRIAVE